MYYCLQNLTAFRLKYSLVQKCQRRGIGSQKKSQNLRNVVWERPPIGLVLCKTTVFFRTCLHFNYLFQNIIRIFGVFEQNSRCGKPKKCAPIRIVTGLEFSWLKRKDFQINLATLLLSVDQNIISYIARNLELILASSQDFIYELHKVET